MTPTRRWLAVAAWLWAAAAGLAVPPAQAQLPAPQAPEASEIWQRVHASVFEGRRIDTAPPGALVLEAPSRAVDAATVPVALRARLPAGDARRVTRLTLVIDRNPSPVAAVFTFGAASGPADIETRVRVDEYTHVRAIAELSDGTLWMHTRFVKASGGCSAPAGADVAAARASLGRMQLRVDEPLRRGQPALARLQISHPNHSGLAMDQATRQYTPAHFVRVLRISYAGTPVLAAELDFAISENPNFRFHFVPTQPGALAAEIVDTQDRRFQTTLALAPAP